MNQRGFSHIIIILVGLVLILLLFGIFAVKRSMETPLVTPQNSFVLERPTHLPCGITVLDPLPNRRVTMPFTVRGYVNGCGWDNAPLTLGYVKVLNDKGQVMSAIYPLVRKDPNFNLPGYFEASIPVVVGTLQTPSGMLFFASNAGKHPSVFEVPISF